MANDTDKHKKKVSFSEEDAATLTQRYDATTLFALLQEVANYPHAKFDWNELIDKTTTGISNAREYQMLWRHLAYGHALNENLEHGVEPLDDDSDLECEREALPPITKETASEAAACVKVMIASHALSESAPTSSMIEAPLTINVPVCRSSGIPNESSQPSNLLQETNTNFPVTVKRKRLPNVSPTGAIKRKGSVSGNKFIKKERKPWSEEEDMQLRAAVQRWGEGNWTDMARRDNFPIKRSPTQLSKDWNVMNDGVGNPLSSTSSQDVWVSSSFSEFKSGQHSFSMSKGGAFYERKMATPIKKPS